MNPAHAALVLTGGGARGAYQAGVLKYLGENLPEAHFQTLVGSSSGAINVAGLASAGGVLAQAGSRIATLWSQLEMDEVFRTDVASLSKISSQWILSLSFGGIFGKPGAHFLVDTKPLEKLLKKVYKKEEVQAALEKGLLKNVAVSATEVNTGSLVTFIHSLQAKNWQRARRRTISTPIEVAHIMASAAIPMLFPSVLIENRQYVDGCIRSTSPLGPAIRLGAEKVLAVGVRRYYMQEKGNYFLPPAKAEPQPTPAQLGALVLNSLFAEALDSDVEHLERLNSILPSRQETSFGMRKVDVLTIRPSEDLGELATQFQRKAPGMIRFLLRGLGSEVGKSSDILSYLLFVPEYLSALVEMGYRDARAEEDRIRKFFEL
jgi:NTE family protein